jgi:hypothetical protein
MAVFDSPSPPDSRLGGEAPLLPHVAFGLGGRGRREGRFFGDTVSCIDGSSLVGFPGVQKV